MTSGRILAQPHHFMLPCAGSAPLSLRRAEDSAVSCFWGVGIWILDLEDIVIGELGIDQSLGLSA